MKILIRQAKKTDYSDIKNVVEQAFRDEKFSDQTKHELVERLRKSNVYIPELSLVATFDDIIVGHILLTEVDIVDKDKIHRSLALAPVSVLPKYQKQGIGAMLIKNAHSRARELKFTSVVLIGHEAYYPRFGYELSTDYNINFPFDVPKENAFVKKLVANGLSGVTGLVTYPPEFGI
ncbi:GNAT family N-acetyltransferase [Urechidicola sp. KH5]